MDDFCNSDKDIRDPIMSRSLINPVFGDSWNDDFYGLEFGTDSLFDSSFNKANGNRPLELTTSYQGVENESTSMFDNFPLSPSQTQPNNPEPIDEKGKIETCDNQILPIDTNANCVQSLPPEYFEPSQTSFSFKIINTGSGLNVLSTSQNTMKTSHNALIEPVNQEEILKLVKYVSNILHSYLCPLPDKSCLYPGCDTFKSIMYHLNNCDLEVCSVEKCLAIRQYLKHFCSCPKKTCLFCSKVYEEASKVVRSIFQSNPTLPRLHSSDLPLKILEMFHLSLVSEFPKITEKEIPPISIQSETKIPDPLPPIIHTMIEKSPKIQVNNLPSIPNNIKVISEKRISYIFDSAIDKKLLIEIFTPIINKLLRSPDAIYFSLPVDPVKLGIPDYPEIIHEPMDLGTILKKLQSSVYYSIWDILYDVNLVFDNAYLYNKKNTRVHKAAVKLSQIFENFSSQLMKSYSYCCNRRYVYSLQALYCNSKDYCVIPCNAYYYKYDDKICFCTNCFDNSNDNMACSKEGSMENEYIEKSKFTKVRNNKTVYEPFVICVVCNKKFHKVCSMHVDVIDGSFFYCESCFSLMRIARPQNPFVSKNLPRTELSDFIEERINKFLRSEFKDCKYVNIRLICNVEKIVETKPGLIQRFGNNFNSSFPYRSKALFAFQELDNKEICFFSMHVQEYGINCPEPNKRRVYLSYLDSVHYFQPKHLKTLLYHEILLSYLAYCKLKGYLYCHIWSCPPCEGDDYVFHCHSFEQKLPKPRRLLEWYNKLIEIGLEKKIILEYKDIFKYFQNYKKELALAIPYFDGDYWSNSLEDIITEYEKDVQTDNNFNIDKQIDKKKAKKKVGKYKNSTPKRQHEDTTLNNKLFSLMEKYREVFFVLKLNDDHIPFINDTNPLFTSDLMDGRSGFLTICRDNHWEFSSSRHAFYSTKAMMFVVHQQMFNFSEYTCDKCRAVLSKGYHCDICRDDFDLCSICHFRFTHEHQMSIKTYITFEVPLNREKITTSIDTNNMGLNKQYDLFISVIDHSVSCTSVKCLVNNCDLIKRLIIHFEQCSVTNRNSCRICRYLYIVYNYHASLCLKSSCKIPFCSRLKKMLNHTRLTADAKTRSRIANMNFQLAPTPIIKNESIEPEPKRNSRTSSISQSFNGKSTEINAINDPIFSRQITKTPIGLLEQSSFQDGTVSPQLNKVSQFEVLQRGLSRPTTNIIRQQTQDVYPIIGDPNIQQMMNRNVYYNIPQHLLNQSIPELSRNIGIQSDMNRQSMDTQMSGNILSAPSTPMDSSIVRVPFVTRPVTPAQLSTAFVQNASVMPQNLQFNTISPHGIKFQLAPQYQGNVGGIPTTNRMISPRNARPSLNQSISTVRLPIHPESGMIIDPTMTNQFSMNPRMVSNFVVQQMPTGQEAILDANGNLVFPQNTLLINNQQAAAMPMNQLNFLQFQQLMMSQGQRHSAPVLTFKPNNPNAMMNMNPNNFPSHGQYATQPGVLVTRNAMQTPHPTNPSMNQFVSFIPPTLSNVMNRPNAPVYVPDINHPVPNSNIYQNPR